MAVFTPTAAVQVVAVTTLAATSAEVTSVGAVEEMVVEASNAVVQTFADVPTTRAGSLSLPGFQQCTTL